MALTNTSGQSCNIAQVKRRKDSGGSSTEQHSIRVTQRNRSSPGLPRPSDLWVGIDAGQHGSQPALVNQPVERTDQVRMITPYYKPTVGPQQQLDLIMCTHIESMRRRGRIVRLRLGSVDEGPGNNPTCGPATRKRIANSRKLPKSAVLQLNRDAFPGNYRPAE
jgi:hypothetical protein